MERDLFPKDIFWENMHLSPQDLLLSQLPLWIILGGVFAGTSGAWYGVTQLELILIESGTALKEIFIVVTSLLANLIAWFMRKFIVKLADREAAILYSDKAIWILWRLLLSDLLILALLPCIILWAVDQRLLW